MAKIGVTITEDHVKKLSSELRELTGLEVMVGIPVNSTRDDSDITNAEVGFVMEFGSPANNIPARPVLIPGVRNGTKRIASQLRKAAEFALDGREPSAVQDAMYAAGEAAANSVRREFMKGDFAPLSEKTIYARQHRGPKSKKPKWNGIKPLLDTSQYRRSITQWFVKKRGD